MTLHAYVAMTPQDTRTPIHGEIYEAASADAAYDAASADLIPYLEEQLELGHYPGCLSLECGVTIHDADARWYERDKHDLTGGSPTAYLGVYCDRCDRWEYPGRDGSLGCCDKWYERCERTAQWRDECGCHRCERDEEVAA